MPRIYQTLVTLVLLACSQVLAAQYAKHQHIPNYNEPIVTNFDDWSYRLSSTITANDIKEHIFTLADDSMEGRETGQPGNDKAADYIKGQFKKMRFPSIGPNGDYNQNVAFTFTSWNAIQIKLNGEEYKLMRDFIAFPQFSSEATYAEDEIIFAGYGIDSDTYTDYKNISADGKILIVFDGEPVDNDGVSKVTQKLKTSEWNTDWKLKATAAKNIGATGLIIISNDLKSLINDNRRQLLNRVTQLGDFSQQDLSICNTWFVSPEFAKTIMGEQVEEIIEMRNQFIAEDIEMTPVTLESKLSIKQKINQDVLIGQNLLGFIEGSDLKDEVVVVSAHYDHVGMKGKEVYNGADDNASGTTTVLEIAEALQTAKLMGKGPRRSILCLLVTGEEKGLLGSDYYSSNPVFPLSQTVADVNIDMVGRRGDLYKDSGKPYIYVIGSDRLSNDLHMINESMNQKYNQLILDYKYNDEADPNRFYYRSDHYNFAKHGIPSIFFFNGVHEDYHRLTDTPDKIDLSLMQTRARQIFHTLWELANRNDRIQLNEDIESP